jgi:signal transduction histidine kinase
MKDQKRATAVYRMVQEMVLNAAKHSGASELIVQFNIHDDEFHITVEDNGTGFDVANAKGGIGMQSIRSRAEFLNADLEIESGSEGTTYRVLIHAEQHV